jgi:ethanolamine utilization cobalamin adenosyltransferase
LRFITEMDLRKLYRQEGFTTYSLENGTKLTPGAKQFLADRRVCFESSAAHKKIRHVFEKECVPNTSKNLEEIDFSSDWLLLKLFRYMEYVESLMLLAASHFYCNGETVLSEEISEMGKQIHQAVDNCQQGRNPEHITFWGSTEEELHLKCKQLKHTFCWKNLPENIKKRENVLLLHHLCASIRNIEPLLLEIQYHKTVTSDWYRGLQVLLQSLVDILCIMIEKYMRGKK